MAYKLKTPYYHIIEVKKTQSSGGSPKLRLTSFRFKDSVVIPFFSYEYNDISGDAIDWLKINDFNVVGKGTSKDGYFIITDTFKELKPIKKEGLLFNKLIIKK